MALTPPDTQIFDFPHPLRRGCVRRRPGLPGSSPRLLQAFGDMLPSCFVTQFPYLNGREDAPCEPGWPYNLQLPF